MDFSSFSELAKSRRTIRLFDQKPVPPDLLRSLVDIARFAPTGSNRQPLKFVIMYDQNLVEKVFSFTAWAGLVRPRRTPPESKRPRAWILVLIDKQIKKKGYETEMGAAVSSILLAARATGLGTCWIGSLNRKELRKLMEIPDRYIIGDIVAIGYPAEQPRAEEAETSNPADLEAVKYYLDDDNLLHVPKRPLTQLLSENAPPPA